MVGVSAFFAGSFHNVILTQEKLDESQGGFSTNEIVREKLSDAERIEYFASESLIVKNKFDEGKLPFTYFREIGGKLVFKDFFVFNGVYENTKSSDSNIFNPAGITKVVDDYYIATPLENTIYKCNPITSCSPWLESELDHPTDITTDGTDIFVSDSKNNRVIKINVSNKNITEFPFKLNFPTGVAFFNGELFVADTYNNRVVKIYGGGSQMSVVAGEGNNTDCDNTTAKLCKLNFPTGLAIDSAKKQLYIADTGSERILIVTDPPTITEYNSTTPYEINTNIEMPGQIISRIDFTFPAGAAISESMIVENDLYSGKFGVSGDTLSMYLSVPMINGDATNQDCTGVPPEDSCPIYFERFTVSDDDNIFIAGKKILIKSGIPTEYTVTGVPQPLGVYVEENHDYEGSYSAGTIVAINEVFGGGYTFGFDLTGSGISSGFTSISTDYYKEDDSVFLSQNNVLRVGDGFIGTAEDTIEEASFTLSYPTGLNWNNGLKYGEGDATDYDINFTEYDYESVFDIANLEFSEVNGGKLLQMNIETVNGDSYIINSALN